MKTKNNLFTLAAIALSTSSCTSNKLEKIVNLDNITKFYAPANDKTPENVMLWHLERAHELVEYSIEYDRATIEISDDKALQIGLGVCRHYADLTKKIYDQFIEKEGCPELKDNVRAITGMYSTGESPWEYHRWLMVKAYGKDLVYESTWDKWDGKGNLREIANPFNANREDYLILESEADKNNSN